MEVELKELLTAYTNGILGIKYEKGASTCRIGNMIIDETQAEIMCTKLGWSKHKVNAFEALQKTESFMRCLKSNLKDDLMWERSKVEFQNKADTDYGKTFDRIVIKGLKRKEFTIIHGMKNAGGAYVVYEYGQAIAIFKGRTLKQVVEFIDTYA